jgi:hypothetical protein
MENRDDFFTSLKAFRHQTGEADAEFAAAFSAALHHLNDELIYADLLPAPLGDEALKRIERLALGLLNVYKAQCLRLSFEIVELSIESGVNLDRLLKEELDPQN